MATIKPRRGTSYPASGLAQNELAVDTTNRRIYLGSAGGSGITVASHLTDYVASINGSTGAITNVARINEGNNFSTKQIMTAGLSASASDTTLEITATSLNGIGIVVARSSNPSDSGARVGRIQLSRSATSTHNTIIENSSGTLNIYNGSTVGTRIASISTSGGVFDVPITGVTFQPTNGIIRTQLGAYIGGDSPIIRIVGTDVSLNSYNSDIRANASAATNTTHTLPSTTGTLLNTTSSYVSGICGATGAITLSAGSGVAISQSSGTFTISNSGVTGAVAGTGISVSAQTGNVTITNTGVQSLNGSTGAITNIAVTNAAQTFSGLQTFSTGITSAGITSSSYVYSELGFRFGAGAISSLTGTTYSLLSSDNGEVIVWSSASSGVTLTIPSGLPVGFNCTVIQTGTASIGITGSGTTLNSFEGKLRTAGQHAAVSIISYSSNVFNIAGGLT